MSPAILGVIFGTSFVVGLSGAVTPGPLLTYDVSESARRGFWTGPWLALGHSVLEFFVVVGLAFGLGALLNERIIALGVGLIGGGVLLWLGLQIVRSAPRQGLRLQAHSAQSNFHPAIGGAVVSLANPYWSIWWITIGASYIFWSMTQAGTTGLTAFYFGHILADFAWYSLVAFLVVSGRRFLSDTAYRGILLACGFFLLGLGAFFIFNGLQALF